MTAAKIGATGVQAQSIQQITAPSYAAPAGRSFRAIYERLSKEFSPFVKDIGQLSKQIGSVKIQLGGKDALSPQQLLAVQMKVSDLQVKTELLSKAADSALQLTKKLQSPQ